MLALLGFSSLASLAVSLVLGVRLIRLWRRTREMPELVIGASFLTAGVIGYLGTILGNPGTPGVDPAVSARIMIFGMSLISVGVALNYLFVWKVFRPESRTAGACFWALSLLLAVTILPLVGDPAAGAPAQLGFVTVLGDLVRMGAGAWGATESLRYYSLMRRRMQIGLAEPAITNRFLLWGLGGLSTSFIFLATSTWARITFASADGALTPGMMVVVSAGTITVAILQWLAFLPPAIYRRRFERAAPAACAGA
jgi:hypothetical protein